MKLKKLPPSVIALATFLGIFLCGIGSTTLFLLAGPLLTPDQPEPKMLETFTTIIAFATIGGPIIAYIWAKQKRSKT